MIRNLKSCSVYGVTVIPEGDADYQHNTSFYILNPEGRLIEVLDYKDPKQLLTF